MFIFRIKLDVCGFDSQIFQKIVDVCGNNIRFKTFFEALQ